LFARLREMEIEHSIYRRLIPRALPHFGYLLVALLLGEAFLMHPRLPLVYTPAWPSAAATVLAKGKGPALVVPLGKTPLRQDTTMYVDQIVHRRPLINSPTFPHVSLATLRMRRSPTWAALDYLGLCEVNPGTKGLHGDLLAKKMGGSEGQLVLKEGEIEILQNFFDKKARSESPVKSNLIKKHH